MSEKIIGRILYEDNFQDPNPIRSASYVGNSKNTVRMEVVLQDVERVNRNNRLYHKKDIDEAIKSDFIQEKLATNSLLGECNHPEFDPKNPGRQLRIDLNNVSHVIKEIYWDKKDPNVLLGIVETAATRVGRDLAGLIMENGMVCSFSMRGTGDVIDKGKYREVVGPIQIRTWDLVHFPSHKAAYMRSIINENTTCMNITEKMLVEEIAKQSNNTQTMLNEFVQMTSNMVDYSYSDGGILIRDKVTKKPLAVSNLEKNLQEDYRMFMAGF